MKHSDKKSKNKKEDEFILESSEYDVEEEGDDDQHIYDGGGGGVEEEEEEYDDEDIRADATTPTIPNIVEKQRRRTTSIRVSFCGCISMCACLILVSSKRKGGPFVLFLPIYARWMIHQIVISCFGFVILTFFVFE